MKKTKTLRALLMSALAMILCVSMLVGSTFAWFTDSVVSGNNVIKSGNLDVAMQWADGKNAVPAVDSAEWIDASTGPIFNYDLWEPGYTVVRHVQIANKGSLALKYQLNMAANGEISKLAEVIDVYYADPAVQIKNRAELANVQPMATLDQALGGMAQTAYGELLPGEVHTVTIALKMKETAGNEYQNLSIGSDFSVILMATQLTAEKDSFDDQYDAAATYLNQDAEGNWLVGSAGDLQYLRQQVNSGNSYKGQIIKLANDIDLKNAQWIPIGNGANGFSGTFDGQGYTISNYTVETENNAGLFGYALNGGNIKNLKVKNAVVKANDYAGAILGRGYTDVVNCSAENVSITVTPFLKADGVTYDGGAKAGAIVGQLLEGAGNTVVDCSVKNVTITGYRDLGGVLGMASSNNAVSGCTAEDVSIVYIVLSGAYDSNTPNQNAGAIVGRIHNSATVDFSDAENAAFELIRQAAVVNATELQAALDAAKDGDIILLGADISGDVTATQKPDVKVTIDGKGKNFAGTITVDGKSMGYATAGLTIKNVKFAADAVSTEACINMGVDGNEYTRYISNLTVENCSFDVPGKVAVKSYSNGDKNLKIIGCTVASGMHSLVQVNNVAGELLVKDCKYYSKNGINVNQSQNVVIEGCTAEVSGYAVRFGAGSGTTGIKETYAIKDCTLNSNGTEGDATVILRGTAEGATLTITGSTITGTPDIDNKINATIK